jgi:hypothetical protein
MKKYGNLAPLYKGSNSDPDSDGAILVIPKTNSLV